MAGKCYKLRRVPYYLDFILSNPKCAQFLSPGYRVAWQAVTYPDALSDRDDVTTPGCKYGKRQC